MLEVLERLATYNDRAETNQKNVEPLRVVSTDRPRPVASRSYCSNPSTRRQPPPPPPPTNTSTHRQPPPPPPTIPSTRRQPPPQKLPVRRRQLKEVPSINATQKVLVEPAALPSPQTQPAALPSPQTQPAALPSPQTQPAALTREEANVLAAQRLMSHVSRGQVIYQPLPTPKKTPENGLERAKSKVVTELQTNIADCHRDIAERTEWLKQLTENKVYQTPQFTKIYSSRSLRTASNRQCKSEEQLLALEQKMTMANLPAELKQELQALKYQAEEEISRDKEKLENDFQHDLKHNPIYIGIRPDEMREVYADFNGMVEKNSSRVLQRLERQTQSLIRAHQLCSAAAHDAPRARKPTSSKNTLISEIDYHRNEDIQALKEKARQAYQDFRQRIKEELDPQRQAFEQHYLPRLVAEDYSAADIKLAQQESEDSLKREYDRAFEVFNVEVTIKTRLAIAEAMEPDVSRHPKQSQHVNNLMSVYLDKASRVILASVPTVTWQRAQLDIDRSFELTEGDWDTFSTLLADYWGYLGDVALERDYQRLVRLYAIVNQVPKTMNDDRDTLIRRLRGERLELTETIRQLDARIKTRVTEHQAQQKVRVPSKVRSSKQALLQSLYAGGDNVPPSRSKKATLYQDLLKASDQESIVVVEGPLDCHDLNSIDEYRQEQRRKVLEQADFRSIKTRYLKKPL